MNYHAALGAPCDNTQLFTFGRGGDLGEAVAMRMPRSVRQRQIEQRGKPGAALRVGDAVRLALRPEDLRVFPA